MCETLKTFTFWAAFTAILMFKFAIVAWAFAYGPNCQERKGQRGLWKGRPPEPPKEALTEGRR